MTRCRKCGREIFTCDRLCQACKDEWLSIRIKAWKQAVDENGGALTAENLSTVQKRTKELERQFTKAPDHD